MPSRTYCFTMSEEPDIPPAPEYEQRNHIVKSDYIRKPLDMQLVGYNLSSKIEEAFEIKANDLLWIDVDSKVSLGNLVFHYSSNTFFGVESIKGLFEKLVISLILLYFCLFR